MSSIRSSGDFDPARTDADRHTRRIGTKSAMLLLGDNQVRVLVKSGSRHSPVVWLFFRNGRAHSASHFKRCRNESFMARRIIFSDFREPAAEEAYEIAYDYIEKSGQMRDDFEACAFLAQRISVMVDEGQTNKIRIANRAINEYECYVRECDRLIFGNVGLDLSA
jgi:hypothetical protein